MTCGELNGLLARVVEQVRQAGIPVPDNIDPAVLVNRRAKTRFGRCIHQGGINRIEVSLHVIAGGEEAVCRVLAHEVLHTCPGCRNHGERWKGYARRMKEVWGYDITRTDTYEGLGLEDGRTIRYLVICQRCGYTVRRMKRSALVDRPERYRCRCGGEFRVERLF